MKSLVVLLLGYLLSVSVAQAQIVTIPIPGSPLSLNVMANPQPLQNIYNNPSATPYQLWDDGWANVPLGFTFPFFDKNFTNSTMYSNGAVQFGPPLTGFPSNNTFCCSGITIDRNTPSAYNYSILMMQDDLYGATGNNHYSLGTSNTMTYGWYNVERLGRPENKTSFELKIDSSGGIDMRWTGALLSYSSPAIGVIGDASKGEFAVLQQGGLPTNTFSIPGLTQWTTGQTPDIIVDPCTTNPLYSPSCSGYQAAYTEQQCVSNPLYSTSCSGYQAAYTQQQCSANPLYSTMCSGYQAAYTEQQCAINPLFSINCPGYASAYLQQQCRANPLYSTTCDGYATAYHDQQCSFNPLYATTCSGYQTAYHNQQCSINPLHATTCTGYAAAYHDQQCSINPLFATTCPGYASAYHNQQCTANALYSTTCSGYAEAYKAQQCSLDGLYDRTCPNYATAYATKMVLEQQGTASIVATAGTVARNDPANQPVSTTTVSTTVGSDGAVAVGVSKTGDSNVDKAIAPPPPSANSATAPAGAVQLAPPPPAPQQQMAQNEPKGGGEPKGGNKQEDKKDDAPKGSGGNSPSQNTGTAQASSDKPAAPTARQAIQERREAAAKAEAVEKGKNLANEMGKASDMEAQKAVQNVVIQAMGFTPGFDAYSKQIIVQQQFYKPYQVYGNQKNIDSRANLRMFGGTDSLHQQMIESQYNKGN